MDSTTHPRPKIVAACDSFKGSLSTTEVASAVAAGIRRTLPNATVVEVAIADGGEGTMPILINTLHGTLISAIVNDPLNRPISVHYGIANNGGDKVAIIEMAEASGLTLLHPDERNPMVTSSYGTGQLIVDAYAHGCRQFIIGLGGSATNDGGTGMLRALGIKFLDHNHNELPDGGAALIDLCHIDTAEARHDILECQFTIICDVNNPLIGPNGASHTFAPQKGASPTEVDTLDHALTLYANKIHESLGVNIADVAGAGAAGGVGAAMLAFCNAKLTPGIEAVLDAIKFDQIIADADLIITGEGHLDSQTLNGKAPYGVLQRALNHNIPTIAIGGRVDDMSTLQQHGFIDAIAIHPDSLPQEIAMQRDITIANIIATTERIMQRFFRHSQ
jgi:glycerate kinase